MKIIILLGFLCSANAVDLGNYTYTEDIQLSSGGFIRGLKDDKYQSFLGIRYAMPPVGQLRFSNPVMADGYTDAIYMPKACIQILIQNKKISTFGSEDCLYLNIYRPNNINYDADPQLDVMVYIHDNRFFYGTIDSKTYGPDYFMKEKSVILVMIQYRLSVLGFLSTGDDESPGNFGLKDQAVALKWVKRNIDRFGGNPDSITIFGHGSGAAAVHMHMLSPMSRGLFNKAIAISGSAIEPNNYPTQNPIEVARKHAELVGIKDVDRLNSRELVQKLREISADKLTFSLGELKKIFDIEPWTGLYRTVVEPKSANGTFLTEDPEEMLKRGDFAKVPFMTGVVHVTAKLKPEALTKFNPYRLNRLQLTMNDILRYLGEENEEAHRNWHILKGVKQRYLNVYKVDNDYKRKNYVQTYFDHSFYYPHYKTLRYMSDSIPVYSYNFSYRGQHSYDYRFTRMYGDYEGGHSDDLIYLFKSPTYIKDRLNDNDQFASKILIESLTAFAKNENPPKHNLQICNARDMKPMCKYTEFYKNELGRMATRISSQFNAGMDTFFDIVGGHTPYIELRDGTSVRGLAGDDYQSFLGIPYAEPPLGHLRFANPVSLRRYKRIYAEKNPPMCIQINNLTPNSTVKGSEDCLYLNIYRPFIKYSNDTKLDVMVYIHGGGFSSGSIHPNTTGPTYFMKEKSVILVTMQYRLSVLGFLSTGDRESPGNFGLKDQALALKWVKDNIDRFGGNRESITIFGHGAGAASVHMHMLSPLSQGLFNKAIAMSGSAIGPYNYPTPDPMKLTRDMAQALKIPCVHSLNSRDLVQKLREVSAEDLINVVAKLKIFSADPMTLYRTVVEPNIRGAFLIEDPETMLEREDFARIPFMTGTVEEEFTVRAAVVINNATQLNELKRPMDVVLPKLLDINIKGMKLATVMRKLNYQYLKGLNVLNDTSKHNLLRMSADHAFNYPQNKTVLYMDNSIPLYIYKFSYRGQHSYSLLYPNNSSYNEAVHGDDLIYLFDSPAIFPEGLNKNDQMASLKLVQAFIAFAKTENDLPKCKFVGKKPLCKYTKFYKNDSGTIDTEEVKYHHNSETFEFWDNLGELNVDPDVVSGSDDRFKDITRILKKKL